MITTLRNFSRVASFVGPILAVSALAVVSVACNNSDSAAEKKSEAAQPAAKASGLEPGFAEVPNVKGLQAKIPATLEPNGLGGAAGFHGKGNKLMVMIVELLGADAKQPFAEAKSGAEEVMFKKWISSEKTADGYALQWEGQQVEGMGASHNFEVRKTVGTKTFKCYGGGTSAAEIATAVEACKSLKAR
jgi:hypothetical protein